MCFLVCDACEGKRFKEQVLEIKFEGKNIANVLDMTINEAIDFFETAKSAETILQTYRWKAQTASGRWPGLFKTGTILKHT